MEDSFNSRYFCTAVVRKHIVFPGQVSTFAALAWTKRSLPMPAQVSEGSCGPTFVNRHCAGLKQRARDEKSQYPVDIRKEDSALVGCFHKQCLAVALPELQHTLDRLLLMIMMTSRLAKEVLIAEAF